MTATWKQGGALRRRRSFVFFSPAGEAFVAVVFVFGVWVSVSVFSF